MRTDTKSLQATAQKIIQQFQERLAAAAQDPAERKRVIKEYSFVLAALVYGFTMAVSEPGSRLTHPKLIKALKTVKWVSGGGTVAIRPVGGGIELASAQTVRALVKLVHNRVASKPSRVLLAASIALAAGLAERRLKTLAAQQPQLQKLEALGLAARYPQRNPLKRQNAASDNS